MPQETKQSAQPARSAFQPICGCGGRSQGSASRPTYQPVQAYSFDAFDTINTVQVYGETNATEAFAALEAEVEHFERLFSHTLSESSLVRVNQAGGAPIEVEPELAELVGLALHYCEATKGLFDITIGSVVDLWREQYGQKQEEGAGKQGVDAISHARNHEQATGARLDFANLPPSPVQLREACSHVNWRGVRVAGNTIQLEDSKARMVLGGIAKGYIADALCKLLQQHGIKHGLVNLGGNVKAFGGKPAKTAGHQTEAFTIGLRVPQPYSLGESAFAHVQLAQGAVVTSGIYERGFKTFDGTFYHHILDPRTGMPAETDLVSATLVGETALEGDGYTTALIIMGLERALEFVEALPNCEAVFVAHDKNIYATSGIGTAIPFTC